MKIGRTPRQKLADATAVLSLVLPIFFGTFVVQAARLSMNPATTTGVVREKLHIEGKGENADSFIVRYTFSAGSDGDYRGQADVSSSPY